jgi:hypothetical protein
VRDLNEIEQESEDRDAVQVNRKKDEEPVRSRAGGTKPD